jgi:hypothetical protein
MNAKQLLVTSPIVLNLVLLGQPALAQNKPAPATPIAEQSNTTANQAATRTDQPNSAGKTPDSAPKLSPGIEEILKLVRAGVSPEVIKSYIDSSPIAYHPSAEDLITLKQLGVSDEIATALLKHGADLRVQAAQRAADAAAAGLMPANRGSSNFDPESYGFWWYHYAYPRALAHANQTLSWPYPR